MRHSLIIVCLSGLWQVKYYNNVLFYNVQQNFMIQTGDPTGDAAYIGMSVRESKV